MGVYELGFGEIVQAVDIPDERVIAVLQGKPALVQTDIPAAIAAAVRDPIGSAPLASILQSGDTVCLIVSDVTRSWIGYEQFLPSILNELNALGIADQDISLLVALGGHRRHTQAEHLAVYGAEVVSRVRIEQSYAKDEIDFEFVGATSFGTRTCLNRHALMADKVILTGGIAYHSMAGFGGGRKSIVPGIASYSTIQANHRLCLNSKPQSGISEYAACGNLHTNLMHQELMEMANMLAPAFLINAIHSPGGGFAGFVSGDWEKAWLAGCELVKGIYGVTFPRKADVVLASAGGSPKDLNLYQGTKAMDNAILTVKDDGVVILTLACPDIGEPPDFSSWFEHDVEWRESHLRSNFTVPGFVALKCGCDLRRIPHILVTLPENRAFVEKAGFIYAADLGQAWQLAEQMIHNPGYEVIVMPDAANTVPILQGLPISGE